MIKSFEEYLERGCLRCALGDTSRCKVHHWREVLRALRPILNAGELLETIKWGVPCYVLDGRNVVMVSALKSHCVVSFFKGILLSDPQSLLELPGPNTHVARVVRFYSVEEVGHAKEALRRLIHEAIQIEKSGIPIPARPLGDGQLPEEWVRLLAMDFDLKVAFDKLSPGKKKGYLIHFAKPKKAETRMARIMKCRSAILAGKGFHDPW